MKFISNTVAAFVKTRLILILLAALSRDTATATSVLFPLNAMFGGSGYSNKFTVTASAPLVVDTNTTSVFVGKMQTVNPGGTNPVIWLEPNNYLVQFPDADTPWRISVPATNITWNALNSSGPLPSFSYTPPFPTLLAGPNVTLTPGTGTLTISATGGGGGNGVTHGTYTLSPTNAGVVTVDLNPVATLPNNISGASASAAVVTGSQSNIIAAVVTNGPVWLAYGTFTNQYLVTGFTNGLSFYNGTNVFDGQLSAGTVLVYTNFTAPAGMTNFLVFNDPNWVNQWGNAWGITTNYPDVNQMVIAISLGSPYGFNGLLGPNNWAIYPFGPVSLNPFIQVFAPGNTLSPILDVAPVSVEASFGTISNLAATSLIVSNGTGAAVAPSLVVTVNRSNSVTMTQDTAGPDARIILNYSTTPSVPGVLTLGNISENVNGVTFAGLEAKTYATNSGGYWLFITKANTDWATRLGGMPGQTIYQKFVMNDLGQFFAGPSELYFGGYNEDDTNHSVGPAFVNAFGMTYPTTNSAPLWIMPGKLPTNAIAGDIGFDGSNLLLVSTNSNGKATTNAIATSDTLTNGSATFVGTGPGLTGIPASVTRLLAVPASIALSKDVNQKLFLSTNASCTISSFVPVAGAYSQMDVFATNSALTSITITITAGYNPAFGTATSATITLAAGAGKRMFIESFDGTQTNLCDVP